jgi:nitrate reductase NapAB chaperone NapD
MAIAGLVLLTTQESCAAVWEALQAATNITELRPGGEPGRFAAVLEAPSRDMEDELLRLRALEGVLTVDIALLSYEDELADGLEIQCAPHKPRKSATQRA